MTELPIAVIAGHICLDLIPQLSDHFRAAQDIFTPGVLSQVGPGTLALGGSVANAGLALHRLGAKTRLLGRIGDDLLRTAILEALREVDAVLVDAIVIPAGESRSYTIVLSPPDVDRGFLHCPGTNDTFRATDLDHVDWSKTQIVHFEYPPLMRSTFIDAGVSLARTFTTAQEVGALVSLEMVAPHPDATSWRERCRNVLPRVDIFMSIFEELLFMLEPLREDSTDKRATYCQPSARLIAELAAELHGLGSPIVVIKLGDQGIYLSTTSRLYALSQRAAWRGFDWLEWERRQLLAPCLEVEVVGTTGSGDCTIARFLCQGCHTRTESALGGRCWRALRRKRRCYK